MPRPFLQRRLPDIMEMVATGNTGCHHKKASVRITTEGMRQNTSLPNGTIDIAKVVGGFFGDVSNKYVAPVLDKTAKSVGGFLSDTSNKYVAPALEKYLAKPVANAVGPCKTPGQVASATVKIVVGSFVAAGAKAFAGFEASTGGATAISMSVNHPVITNVATGAGLGLASKAMEDSINGKVSTVDEYLISAALGSGGNYLKYKIANIGSQNLPQLAGVFNFFETGPIAATDANYEAFKAYYTATQNPSVTEQILLQVK